MATLKQRVKTATRVFNQNQGKPGGIIYCCASVCFYFDAIVLFKLSHSSYRLFMCQDENENEPEDESFRSFWIKPVTNKPGFGTIIH